MVNLEFDVCEELTKLRSLSCIKSSRGVRREETANLEAKKRQPGQGQGRHRRVLIRAVRKRNIEL